MGYVCKITSKASGELESLQSKSLAANEEKVEQKSADLKMACCGLDILQLWLAEATNESRLLAVEYNYQGDVWKQHRYVFMFFVDE